MTIAELLVQTTATLMAAVKPEWSTFEGPGGCYRTYNAPRPIHSAAEAHAKARAIVAAVYGEPCVDGLDGFTSADGQPFELHGTGGEACIVCGWPRSSHGVKP